MSAKTILFILLGLFVVYYLVNWIRLARPQDSAWGSRADRHGLLALAADPGSPRPSHAVPVAEVGCGVPPPYRIGRRTSRPA